MKKLFLAAFIFGCFTLQSGAATTTSLWPRHNRMTVAEFVEYLRSVNPFLTIEELRELAQDYFSSFINAFGAKDDKDKDKDKNGKGEVVGEDDPRPYSLY